MNIQTSTGGAAIVDALIANGVDTVFGLPGAQMYPFFDALQVNAERVRLLGARHEQTCAYGFRLCPLDRKTWCLCSSPRSGAA